MPRHSSLPTLFDYCKSLTVSDLKRLGYLERGKKEVGIITWRQRGEITAQIYILVSWGATAPAFTLTYRINDAPRTVTIKLTAVRSNLGRGKLWYFICPHTSRRCRKLYLINGYFCHHSGFRSVFYEQQTLSAKSRGLYQYFRFFWGSENAYEQLYTKHFRKTYKGKKTKRYRRVLRDIERGEGINEEDLLL